MEALGQIFYNVALPSLLTFGFGYWMWILQRRGGSTTVDEFQKLFEEVQEERNELKQEIDKCKAEREEVLKEIAKLNASIELLKKELKAKEDEYHRSLRYWESRDRMQLSTIEGLREEIMQLKNQLGGIRKTTDELRENTQPLKKDKDV